MLLQRHCAEEGLTADAPGAQPPAPDPIGTLKSTWLSPRPVPASPSTLPRPLLLATLDGFSRLFTRRSRRPTLRPMHASAHSWILDWEIRLPQLAEFSRNPYEFRSADIARLRPPTGTAGGSGPRDQPHGDRVRRAGLPLSCCPPACPLAGGAPAWRSFWRSAPAAPFAKSPPCRRPHRDVDAGGPRAASWPSAAPFTSERVLRPLPGDRCGVHSQKRRRDQLFEADNFMLASRQLLQPRPESRLAASASPSSTPMLSSVRKATFPGWSPPVPITTLHGLGQDGTTSSRVLVGGKPLANLYGCRQRAGSNYDPTAKGQVQAWRSPLAGRPPGYSGGSG